MISERQFIKDSRELGLPEKMLQDFFRKLIAAIAESHQERPDWKKIMKIEDEILWPVIRTIGDSRLPIYEGAEEGDRNSFILSITDEIRVRLNTAPENRTDSNEYLRILTQGRLKFFEKLLKVTPDDIKDFKSGSHWLLWLLAGGVAVAIAGKIASGKKNTDKKKDEKK